MARQVAHCGKPKSGMVVVLILQVAVKIASGCPSDCKEGDLSLSTHDYTYDGFLQAEWQAYHTFMAEVASAAKGFPSMLAAGGQMLRLSKLERCHLTSILSSRCVTGPYQ